VSAPTSTAVPAIETVRLGKTYAGGTRALADVDLSVSQGNIFGLLGQNGAGKTTLIRILLDMIRPTSGYARVLGADTQRDPVEARRHVGYLSSSPRFYAGMTGAQMIDLVASLRAVDLDRPYVDHLVDRLDLNPSRVISTLSRGNQQKVGLIAVLATKPEVVMLDEPTSGLDPLMQEEVLAIVREVAQDGRTVFFSSHLLHEVEHICDRAAVLRDGELVGVFDLAAERRLAVRQVVVTFDAPLPESSLATIEGARVLARDGARITFGLTGEVDALLKALAAYHVREIEAHAPTLEDFFFTLYRGDAPDPAPAAEATP
jgi:ABC-2 type transport system ATP-binding protein